MQGRTRVIYAARSGEGELVAVHVLDAGLVDGMGEWFAQAATARGEIQHPVLPRTISVGRLDDGRPFEVTELLDGTSMREALDASPEGLDPLAVVRVVNEVASALDALHARTPPVAHRTLCPEHVIMLRDTHEVRLLGLFNADRPQFEGVRPGYRSPEELAGVLGHECVVHGDAAEDASLGVQTGLGELLDVDVGQRQQGAAPAEVHGQGPADA